MANLDGNSSNRMSADEIVSSGSDRKKEDDFGGRRININIGRVKATKEVAEQDDIVKNFVKVQTSVSAGCKLKIDAKTRNGRIRSVQYWFEYKNNGDGIKSRMELSTGFIDRGIYNQLIQHENEEYFRKDSPLPAIFQVYCTAANRPIEDMYTYEYKLKIVEHGGNDDETNVILTQWHDSPDPRIIKYKGESPVKISTEQLYKLSNGKSCKQGILDRRTQLCYQQGGYPQLSLHLKQGNLIVTSRSDERYFTPKGGCGHNVKGRQSDDYPRQQIHTLLNIPKYKLMGRKLLWKWKIKWSNYGLLRHNNDVDPGVLLSDSWIRLWVDGEKLIDWIGPCGANSQGRVPFFKIGFYNPTGCEVDMKMMMKKYKFEQQKTSELTNEEINKISSLDKKINNSQLINETEYNRSAMRKVVEKHPCLLQQIS